MREARARRDLIAGELATGRNPADVLRAMVERPKVRTFAECAEAYLVSRPDVGAETRRATAAHLRRLLPALGERDPATITPSDVMEWIGSNNDLKPSSLARYVSTLRQLLDFAAIDPNPARDRRVRLPRAESQVVEPPTAADVEAILAYVPPRWRLPLRTLEQTGLRIGELHALEWRDVDVSGSRFRIRTGKTATARRWVAVPSTVMGAIVATCPPDDRTPERRVFPSCSPRGARGVMTRACRAAGIASFSPHDLRHRYASVKIAEGVPVTQLAAQLGHSKKSLTFDVYSHVLLDG
jgi:integrase